MTFVRKLVPWVLSIALLLAIHLVFQSVRVEGISMEPTLLNGQYLVMNKMAYKFSEPRDGDIILLHSPVGNQTLVKRLVGTPGDLVNLPGCRTCPIRLGPDQYFVAGDNRPQSLDSRRFGPVNRDVILGKVEARFWPLGQASALSTSFP